MEIAQKSFINWQRAAAGALLSNVSITIAVNLRGDSLR
jgi:hypothetical protein